MVTEHYRIQIYPHTFTFQLSQHNRKISFCYHLIGAYDFIQNSDGQHERKAASERGALLFRPALLSDFRNVPESVMPPLTPSQIRGARGMLGWSMVKLAEAAGVSVSTVKRMEMATPQPLSADVFACVQSAFEAAGVRFLFDSGRGEGVWFEHG